MQRIQKVGTLAAVLIVSLLTSYSALGQTAPDPTALGPYATVDAEYRLPSSVDPEITTDRVTEVWAVLWRPDPMPAGALPLLVFFHGNHGTCGRCTDGSTPDPTGHCPPGVARSDSSSQYTTSGTCPAGFVVTPNHRGYDYVASRLASWGYLVVSINANRGITAGGGIAGDGGLNLMRGRLALKHLEKLSQWNRGVEATPDTLGVDLTGKIDLSRVGLMGHSRGGEGQRATYNQYRDTSPPSPWPGRIVDPVTFLAIYEIGPVDGQTARILNADGTVWNVLLPMCDGDVSNLQGVKPFDRMMLIRGETPATQKSTFTVWGANHNFFNTEWQISDSGSCFGAGNPPLFTMPIQSPQQQQVNQAGMMALFRGNVPVATMDGYDPLYNRNFNPQIGLPAVVTDVTRVDRGYTDSPSLSITDIFDDFDQPTGFSTYGIPSDAIGLAGYSHGTVTNHDATQRAALLSWDSAGASFQSNLTPTGMGFDLTSDLTLDFRISRQNNDGLNPAGPTDLSIALANSDGTYSSPVLLSSYVDVRGPVGQTSLNRHPILQTARIPLSDFVGATPMQIRGVRFSFDQTATGAIYLANIRGSAISDLGGAVAPQLGPKGGNSLGAGANLLVYTPDNAGNRIRVDNLGAGRTAQGVTIQVSSNEPFIPRDELAILRVGNREFDLSGYPDNGDTRTLIFRLSQSEAASIKGGGSVSLQYGRGDNPSQRWEFGRL